MATHSPQNVGDNSSSCVSSLALSPNGRRSRVGFSGEIEDTRCSGNAEQRRSSASLREAAQHPSKTAPLMLACDMGESNNVRAGIMIIDDVLIVDGANTPTAQAVAEASTRAQAFPRYSSCPDGASVSATTKGSSMSSTSQPLQQLPAIGKQDKICSTTSRRLVRRPEVEHRIGQPLMRVHQAEHASSWDNRHHLAGCENALLPKTKRAYFSRPQSLPELRKELLQKPPALTRPLLRRLDRDETPPTVPTPITADAGPPACPARHIFGGSMKDRDGEVRPWNDRWHTGVHIINDSLHPSHRGGFSTRSLFENAQSQDWRRHQDFETAHGVWKSSRTRRPDPFGPMGV